LLDRLVVLAGVVIVESEVRVDQERERIALARQLNLSKRFLGPAGSQQIDAVPVVRRRVVRIEFDRATKLRFGSRPVPLEIQLDVAQRGVRLSKRPVQLKRLQCMAPRHGKGLSRSEPCPSWPISFLAGQKRTHRRK
jgi:hypothetical protein